MEKQKKILLALPASLVDKLDHFAARTKRSRSALIRSVLLSYAEEAERQDLTEQMKAGYEGMSDLNLALAEEALPLDTEQQISYEETLSECEG